ncbi:thioesterase family protein [Xylaria longipes]|nr:thioesterase family protein [Xylaria longipes]
MVSGNASWACVPLADAIKIHKLDSHTYKLNLDPNYCIGAVPNGGYVLIASCMLAAANAHLASRDKPDTLTAHFEYPARTSPGPGVVVIEDVKLGRSQLSTLHLTLWQGGLQSQKPWVTPSVSKRVILAYTTHANLRAFGGLSMPTGYEASPVAAMPEPLPDFQALKTNGADGAREESKLPTNSGPLHSLRNWRFYLPRADPLTPGLRFLTYLVDSFPFNMHAYLAAPEIRKLFLTPPPGTAKSAGSVDRDEEGQVSARASLWLPTVVMNLEVKTALPEEGAEWLAVRVTSTQIKGGRFDLELLLRDVEGEIVALSHHVALILSIERNMAKQDSSSKLSL